jgi:hypothetical protein
MEAKPLPAQDRFDELRKAVLNGERETSPCVLQIKFLLGQSSTLTTERYLGSQQELAVAVNDGLGF